MLQAVQGVELVRQRGMIEPSADITIRTCHLSKSFGGIQALDDLSLEIPKGAVYGLIGPNGSGKTTLFNVLTGIYAPSNGRIEFDGRDLTSLGPPAIYRSGIARTFQRSRLNLALSVFDNVVLGHVAARSAGLIQGVLKIGVGKRDIPDAVNKVRSLLAVFDDGLPERLWERVDLLPMIDRRRIEICRALVGDPKVLLLDEPSAGMTHDETDRLMDDILSYKRHHPELTVVVIEHEMAVIEKITSICAVLNFGKLLAEGSYREVAAHPLVQEAYLGAT